jgi:hypothetical protein
VAPNDRRTVRAVPTPSKGGARSVRLTEPSPFAPSAAQVTADSQGGTPAPTPTAARQGSIRLPDWDEVAWPDADDDKLEEAAWPGGSGAPPAGGAPAARPGAVPPGGLLDGILRLGPDGGRRVPAPSSNDGSARHGRSARQSPGGPRLARLALVVVLVAGLITVAVAMARGGAEEPARAAGGTATAPAAGRARTIMVATTGTPAGDGSAERPYRSVQQALVDARPGDTVAVAAGTYTEGIHSIRPGRPGAPIRLLGEGARIAGATGANILVEITHDDIEVRGFDLSKARSLLWIAGASRVRVISNTLHDAGGECVRLRGGSVDNEIGGNRIERCGQAGFVPGGPDAAGEGIYIGTATARAGGVPDASNGNWIHDNVVSAPAECVDIAEHALGNRIEANTCGGAQDPAGGGIGVRGNANVVRANVVTGGKGGGIRLGGERGSDGVNNVVVGNRVTGNAGFGLLVQRRPQSAICGNAVDGNAAGTSNVGGLDPSAACPR